MARNNDLIVMGMIAMILVAWLVITCFFDWWRWWWKIAQVGLLGCLGVLGGAAAAGMIWLWLLAPK